MNAVEIEEAVSELAARPFDPEDFPYAFLTAFAAKETTIRRLRSGGTNKSDIGGVCQINNIHIKVCQPGEVTETLAALRDSPATGKAKVKFILATDGEDFQAEEVSATGDLIACKYPEFPDKFGFFLPLAGISTVRQIQESAFDIKATGRLNRLYVELLKANPGWETGDGRSAMNHFMARLIFCFFAEDTGIFEDNIFTRTIEMMTRRDGSNTHEVIAKLFLAMCIKKEKRKDLGLANWAGSSPHVGGWLFNYKDGVDIPHFSQTARSYLLHIGNLDWKEINPDIFGSMIQAVGNKEERESLGMHYTSVPNILKVLNPLFLDDLRNKLSDAGEDRHKLQSLKDRMAKIRIFDPACGSGNFLVIAYKQMREIEAKINNRLGDPLCDSSIPLTNFRGIEINSFPAEVARLALLIAEFQCNEIYLGPMTARKTILPINEENWIRCDNALRIDWMGLCPPTGKQVEVRDETWFNAQQTDQTLVEFANEGGETYICGNPPYHGKRQQSVEQKSDMKEVFGQREKSWRSLDYVAGWFMKAADYGRQTGAASAFVSTNSICQGQQVARLWPLVHETGHAIVFAYTSFKWTNNARDNAGVSVVIVGISTAPGSKRSLYSSTPPPPPSGDQLPVEDASKTDEVTCRQVDNINAYLTAAPDIFVHEVTRPLTEVSSMVDGNMRIDSGYLLLDDTEVKSLGLSSEQQNKLIRRAYGALEFIKGQIHYCLWIEDQHLEDALANPSIRKRIEGVRSIRLASPDKSTNKLAESPHRFREMRYGKEWALIVGKTSSENRRYLPVGLLDGKSIITNKAQAIYDAPLWNMALIASRIHLIWIQTVCGRLGTGFSYSATLGWNTFPLPKLTEQNKADLTRSAENILLAREAHFPATMAELYAPNNKIPEDLAAAHEQNDELLERIYIGRRFKNDTERLEKLFELYKKMTDPKR